MYRSGHYGAALLAYAPVGLFVSISGYEPLAIVGGVVAVALSTTPDYDRRLPAIDHRGPTHTLVFALLVGAALAGGAAIVVSGPSPFSEVGFVLFAFVVGVVSVGSHLVVDALTPAGVKPFWPISNRRYALNVSRGANTHANYALLGSGVLVSVGIAVGNLVVF